MNSILNIGSVPYLNALPLIDGLALRPDVKLTYAVPSDLAQELSAGRMDAAMVPVPALFDHPEFELFPETGIASDKAAGSVLFFGAGSGIQKVACDRGSLTSALLLKILLAEEGLSPEFVPARPDLEVMLARADGALLIGDSALACRRDPRLKFDLVERWRKLTGLPFLFAVWAARADHPRRAELSRLFAGSLEAGLGRLESIAREKAGAGKLTGAEILNYFTKNMTYRLTPAHFKALELFRQKCLDLPARSVVEVS